MRIPACIVFAALFALAGSAFGAGITFHVSPAGNDSWTGTLATPNAAGTDGPFRSLERARDAVRSLKAAGKYPKTGGVTVFVGGGTYRIEKTLALTSEDSGTKRSPVVWRGRPGETAVLSGGVTVTGLGPVSDPVVLRRLDPAARGKVLAADLKALGVADYGEASPARGKRIEVYFRGKFLTLARYPNEGWLTIADVPQTGPKRLNEGLDRDTSAVPRGRHYGRFTYEGDRPAKWAASDDIWVHGYWVWDWADEYLRAARIDTASREVHPAEPHHGYGYAKGQRFYFLNILEELDAPGEWYLDRTTGILYIWPPETPREGDVTVSALEAPMIALDGASHVTVRGLALENSRGAAVTAKGGSDVTIAGCSFRNFGRTCVTIDGGERNGVRSCDIHDTAAGGVIIHGGDRAKLIPAGNYADNCHIHDFAIRLKTYNVAVEITGVGNRAAHNLIHDAPHAGIFLSTSTLGNDHVIEYNELHSLAKETGDVGAIYLCARDFTMRGNVIRYNYLHDLYGPGEFGVMGIYLDDFTSGTTVYGNILYRAGRGCLVGGGRNNTVENNVFVECLPSAHLDGRGLGWAKSWFEGAAGWKKLMENMNYTKPPYSTRYPELLTLIGDQPAVPKYNRFVKNVSWGPRWFDRYDNIDYSLITMTGNVLADTVLVDPPVSGDKAAGPDERAKTAAMLEKMGNRVMTGDPGFVDAAKLDFKLKKGSPALKMGFKPIPADRIGLVADEYRREIPKR